MAAARPLVSVQGLDGGAGEQTALPAVFTAPIRPDIVRTVHTNMAKNHRQPYAVSMKAGHGVRGGPARQPRAAAAGGTGGGMAAVTRAALASFSPCALHPPVAAAGSNSTDQGQEPRARLDGWTMADGPPRPPPPPRPRLSRGALAAPCPASPACPAVARTAPARVPSATCE